MERLVDLLVDELVMSPLHARRALKMIVGYLGDELATLGKAHVVGLGTFTVGATPGRRAVGFRAAKALRRKLNRPEAAIGGAVPGEDLPRLGGKDHRAEVDCALKVEDLAAALGC